MKNVKMKELWKSARGKALGLLYPERLYCMACGHPVDPELPYGLCRKCFREMRFLTDAVGEPEPGKLRVYAATRYDLWEKEILYALKYNGAAYYAKDMALMMTDMLRMHVVEFDAVVPVPLHAAKLRKRGYNQAECLAKGIAESFGVPLYADAILREKETDALKTLGYTERKMMLENAFRPNPHYCDAQEKRSAEQCANPVAGKRILLVDDIYTSGSTTEVCAGVLQKMGACDTIVAVFSKTSYEGTA